MGAAETLALAFAVGPILMALFVWRSWPLEHAGSLASLLFLIPTVVFDISVLTYAYSVVCIWFGFFLAATLALSVRDGFSKFRELSAMATILASQAAIFSALSAGTVMGSRFMVTSLL